MKKAAFAIAGSTGLIGAKLRSVLTLQKPTEKALIFARKEIMLYSNEELVETDFKEILQLEASVGTGFCALGTTIKKAGSKAAFRAVDIDMVLAFANWCLAHGAKTFVVVSSVGADGMSSNFYLRTKGEMEEAISKIGFEKVIVLRPSLLLGSRKEFRLGENIGTWVAKVFPFLFIGKFKKYKPVYAIQVVRAMLDGVAKLPAGRHIVTSESIATYPQI